MCLSTGIPTGQRMNRKTAYSSSTPEAPPTAVLLNFSHMGVLTIEEKITGEILYF